MIRRSRPRRMVLVALLPLVLLVGIASPAGAQIAPPIPVPPVVAPPGAPPVLAPPVPGSPGYEWPGPNIPGTEPGKPLWCYLNPGLPGCPDGTPELPEVPGGPGNPTGGVEHAPVGAKEAEMAAQGHIKVLGAGALNPAGASSSATAGSVDGNAYMVGLMLPADEMNVERVVFSAVGDSVVAVTVERLGGSNVGIGMWVDGVRVGYSSRNFGTGIGIDQAFPVSLSFWTMDDNRGYRVWLAGPNANGTVCNMCAGITQNTTGGPFDLANIPLDAPLFFGSVAPGVTGLGAFVALHSAVWLSPSWGAAQGPTANTLVIEDLAGVVPGIVVPWAPEVPEVEETPLPDEAPATSVVPHPAPEPTPEPEPMPEADPAPEGADSWLGARILMGLSWLGDRIGGFFNWLVDSLWTMFEWLVARFWEIIRWLAERILQGFIWLASFMLRLFTQLLQFLGSIANAIIRWLSAILTAIVDGLGALGTLLVSWLVWLGNFLLDGIRLIMEWLLDGIRLIIEWLLSGISLLFEWLLGGIQAVLVFLFVPTFDWATWVDTLTPSPNGPTVTEWWSTVWPDPSMGSMCGPTIAVPEPVGFTAQIPAPPESGCPGNGPGGARTAGDDLAGDLYGFRVPVRTFMLLLFVWVVGMRLLRSMPWANRGEMAEPVPDDAAVSV
jgi:hypothetical protein